MKRVKTQEFYSNPSVFNTPIFTELIKKMQNIPRFRSDYNPIYSYSISSFTTAYTVHGYVCIEDNNRHDHQS
jgi:hypothetical protein